MAGEAEQERAAREAVRQALGCAPIGMERMRFGHNSVTYTATFGGERAPVILRTNANPNVFAKTESNLAALAGLGLPVSRVLASDLSRARFPFAFLILENIEGRDLRWELPTMTRAQMTTVAAQIVGYQKTAATKLAPGSGFGYVPIGEPGPYPTWKALLQAEEAKSRPACADDDPFRHWNVQLDAAFARLDAYLETIEPTCFLDDTTTKNVIVKQGELRGLIDFDVVCYGDPLLMVGLTAAAVVCDVGLHALFYVDELRRLWELSPDQSRAADWYSALFTLHFLRRAHQAEPSEWTARMVWALQNRWLAGG